ncbi:hypothetical protein AC578_1972 [Pseudocercospora eumusae]|uniref:Beta-lactamase-related domain-containing protein n=1 Tax=Pseudocercospora eumusae TaxID=321146 RepID=A0A139H2A6_9PEZI|nr:hypothetical protein AC578_1972 [Pseudocercospora eumusae]
MAIKSRTKGNGVTRLGGPPIISDTIIYSASMSKSSTTGAIALMIQDEEKESKDQATINWDTPVSSMIRDDIVLSGTYSMGHANPQNRGIWT